MQSTDWPAPASFVDPDSGLTEVIEYIPGSAGPLYTVLHKPASTPTVGVVIAPAFLMEFQRNYRRDVLLARGLAAAGVAVMRFSYRGQGHSGGDTSDLGFTTALDDASAVVEHFRSAADFDELVMLGTRLGGLVAAAAGRQAGAKRLVVNDPVPKGAGWVRELSRADRVQAMRDPDAEYVSFADRIEQDGMADVLGFAVHGPLVDEAPDHDLETEITDELAAALFVQFGRPEKIAAGLTKLADALTERGIAATVDAVSEEEGWWASRRGDYFVSETVRPLTTEMVPKVVQWVTS